MSLGRCRLVVLAASLAFAVNACGGGERAQRATPVSPTAVVGTSPTTGGASSPTGASAAAAR